MPIKLKSLAPKIPGKPHTGSKSGKELFRGFVERATSPSHRDDPFWEELRKKTMREKANTAQEMFDRWQILAGIKK